MFGQNVLKTLLITFLFLKADLLLLAIVLVQINYNKNSYYWELQLSRDVFNSNNDSWHAIFDFDILVKKVCRLIPFCFWIQVSFSV